MQVVIVSEARVYVKKVTSLVATKEVEKKKIEETKPMKFGDLDDVIRAVEYEIHELHSCAEILKFKATAPLELCIREYPPITFSFGSLADELTKAMNRLYLLQLEKKFALRKKKNKNKK